MSYSVSFCSASARISSQLVFKSFNFSCNTKRSSSSIYGSWHNWSTSLMTRSISGIFFSIRAMASCKKAKTRFTLKRLKEWWNSVVLSYQRKEIVMINVVTSCSLISLLISAGSVLCPRAAISRLICWIHVMYISICCSLGDTTAPRHLWRIKISIYIANLTILLKM